MPNRKTKKGINRKTKKRINRKIKKKKMKGGGPRWDRARDSVSSAGNIAIQRGSAAIGRLRQGVSSTAQWLAGNAGNAGNAGFPDYLPIEDESSEDIDPDDPSDRCYLYYRDTHTHTLPHRFFIDYNDILTQVQYKIAEETDSYSSQGLQSDEHLMSNLFILIRDYTRSNSKFGNKYEELFDRILSGQYNSDIVDIPPEHRIVINTFIHIINGMDLFDKLFAEQDRLAEIEYVRYIEEYIPMHRLGGSGTHPPESIDCPQLFEECDDELFDQFPAPKPNYEYVDDIRKIIEPAGLLGDIKNRIKYFIISHYITDGALRRYLKAMYSTIVKE